MRTRRLVVPFAVILALVLTACHKNLVFETPKAEQAYTCQQILKPVGALQETVIAAEAKGTLKTADAILAMHGIRIIEYTLVSVPKGWKTAVVLSAWQTGVAALGLPPEMPSTWQQVVRVVWAQLKVKVPALATNTYIQLAWAGVDGMIGG